MKKIKYIAIALFLLTICVAGAVGIFAYTSLYTVPQIQDRDRSFTVNAGESLSSVAFRLENDGYIQSAMSLQIFARVSGADTGIQKGAYIIPGDLNAVEILSYLSSGRQSLIRITIPEGKTIRQIAAIFEDSGIISAREFKDAAMNADIAAEYDIPFGTMEGYLFPETYYFAENYPAEKIVRHLANTFFDELEKIHPGYDDISPGELHKILTLASIVEREYVADEEAELMASVFYNRLDKGMRLESCATVVYVMTEEEGLEHPTRLFFSDLERPSPFNTYSTYGLPPAPISGVGRIALNAAFNPADTEYLFFVLESPDAPNHVFSKSYADHQLASEVYYFKLN